MVVAVREDFRRDPFTAIGDQPLHYASVNLPYSSIPPHMRWLCPPEFTPCWRMRKTRYAVSTPSTAHAATEYDCSASDSSSSWRRRVVHGPSPPAAPCSCQFLSLFEPPQVAETQARRRTGTAGFVEPPHKKAKPEKKAQHVCAIVGGRVFDCNFAMGFNVDAKSFRTASDATRDSCAQACMFTCAPEPLSDAGSWTVSSKGQWRLRGLAGANLTSVSRAYALSRVGD